MEDTDVVVKKFTYRNRNRKETGKELVTLVSGVRDGISKTWYDNKQLRTEQMWENGMLNGPTFWWHKNGEPKAEEHYKNDEPEGVWKRWDRDGYLEYEGEVDDYGRSLGLIFMNERDDDELGRVVDMVWYENGKEIRRETAPASVLEEDVELETL